MARTDPPGSIRLTCRPDRAGNLFTFPYRIENGGAAPIWVMDALPGLDPDSRQARVIDQPTIVVLQTTGDALVGKFVPPLPTDRDVLAPLTPLAVLLKPGEALERTLTVPSPLAEWSPYLPEALFRTYEAVSVQGLVFAVDCWPFDVAGLAVMPAAYSPGHHGMHGPDPGGAAWRVTQRFPSRNLQLFRRLDEFPREVRTYP